MPNPESRIPNPESRSSPSSRSTAKDACTSRSRPVTVSSTSLPLEGETARARFGETVVGVGGARSGGGFFDLFALGDAASPGDAAASVFVAFRFAGAFATASRSRRAVTRRNVELYRFFTWLSVLRSNARRTGGEARTRQRRNIPNRMNKTDAKVDQRVSDLGIWGLPPRRRARPERSSHLPGIDLEMIAHLFPCIACAARMSLSSSAVNGPRFTSGFS